jgi:hypothetical protein
MASGRTADDEVVKIERTARFELFIASILQKLSDSSIAAQ